MSSCAARDYFIQSKIPVDALSNTKNIHLLCELVKKELENHDELKMDVVFNQKKHLRIDKNNLEVSHFSIRVKSFYFDDREAITYERDYPRGVGGWFGFAGWASDNNVMPFINAFKKWCDLLKEGV